MFWRLPGSGGFGAHVEAFCLLTGERANAFYGNDFLPSAALSHLKNHLFKKNFGTDTLTRIESGLIGFASAYMFVRG
ncbi:hypothetical protein [Labrenzia sp. VG12]|uniref:hypothetical protein n=1 Tax=Labrenzia sp. VG12 TaxID=2021862 RepID=UPI0012FD9627|nr:hypothetical protein [Labrenzia sp. VG12]